MVSVLRIAIGLSMYHQASISYSSSSDLHSLVFVRVWKQLWLSVHGYLGWVAEPDHDKSGQLVFSKVLWISGGEYWCWPGVTYYYGSHQRAATGYGSSLSHIFKPFWEAVEQLERCGFQVLGWVCNGLVANSFSCSNDHTYIAVNPFTHKER